MIRNSKLEIRNSLALAPMAGITDLAFRLTCRKFSKNFTGYTEMISAAGLRHARREKSLNLALSNSWDSPLVLQLFGSRPEDFAFAARLISNLEDKPKDSEGFGIFKPDGIDINFGCPVKKVTKTGAGSALMRKPKLAREIVQATLENTDLPVSVKIRAGAGEINALQFLDRLADLNWQTVIVHGRTFHQGFSGPIDLELIKKIKQTFPEKTVVANGGIFSPQDAGKILGHTNADGIAVARGASGNPWIFRQIETFLQTGGYAEPTFQEIKSAALFHVRTLEKIKQNSRAPEMRKHLIWYFKNFPGAKELRKKLIQAETTREIEKILETV